MNRIFMLMIIGILCLSIIWVLPSRVKAEQGFEALENGGFESGDLTGWSVGGEGSVAVVTTNPHSGQYCANITGVSSITQMFPGIPISSIQSITLAVRMGIGISENESICMLIYSDTREPGVIFWGWNIFEGVTNSWSSFDVTSHLWDIEVGPTILLTGIFLEPAGGVGENEPSLCYDDVSILYTAPPQQSSTSVSCSPNPVSIGQPVTCTATVSGSSPTGNVIWSTSSTTGSFSQPICTLSSGTCSTTYTDNLTGSVTIAASYSGDSNNTPSGGNTTLTVTPEGTSVSCSRNPVPIFQPITCTATVSGFNPTGTVTWSTSSLGGSLNQSVCALSDGTCSTTYIDNLPGSVTITASYSGDPNNAPSSGSTNLIVTSGGPIYYSQNYSSVQAAIDAAPPGATVIIAPGFYTESLTVNKPLTIVGEKDPPVFSGGASAIFLTLLSGASGSNVTGLEITNFPEGILVDNASNVSIYGNIMASIGSSGIVLEGNNATNNVIYGNIFQDVPTPINLTASAGYNTIYGNIISSQTTVTLNVEANGNSIYGNIISGNEILVNLTNSNGNVIYHNNFLTATRITVLVTGNNTLNNGYPSGGNYWSIAPNIIGSSITDHSPLMKPWPQATGHCVGIISVVTAKTVIGQGFNCTLTVNAADTGEYTESFNVTTYANAKGIGTQQVNSLNASCQTILTFAWNTSDLAYGNYTVSAYAQPVAGQNDTSSNDFTLGTVKVTIPGDINGDFKVSLADLVLLANAYSSHPNQAKWNPNADVNGNGAVDLSDLVILANHYGQHYP